MLTETNGIELKKTSKNTIYEFKTIKPLNEKKIIREIDPTILK